MKSLLIAIVLLGCCVLNASAQKAKPRPDAEAKTLLERLEQDNNRARVTADRRTLENLYADEFAGVNARGGATTKAQIVSFYTETKEDAAKLHATDQTDIRVFGETAIVKARLKYQYRADGDVQWLRYTRVYVLRANRWQIVAEHFCFIPDDEE